MNSIRPNPINFKLAIETIGTLFLILVFVGCAGISKIDKIHDMPLKPGAGTIDSQNTAICLISLKTENRYKPKHTPNVLHIRVLAEDSGKEYYFCTIPGGLEGAIGYGIKAAFSSSKSSGPEESLLSLKIPPGSYRLVSISGNSINPKIRCNFEFPFEIPFQVRENGVLYLGRIEMVNREKISDDDISSGSTFPLLAQWLCGFSGGTFDVTISDNFEADMIRYKKEFPALVDQDIKKNILPPWKKSEAVKSNR